ncbi:hypothetical protein Q7P37_001239 [Cladosporium fusiforme]
MDGRFTPVTAGQQNTASELGRQDDINVTERERVARNNKSAAAAAPVQYSNISAADHARQHNGDVYGGIAYHHSYTRGRRAAKDDPVHDDFIRACAQGRIKTLDHLRDDGANPRHKDRMSATALHHAAFNGRTDVVQYLLDNTGADYDAVGPCVGSPLSLAALRGHLAIVKLLIDHDSENVNQDCGLLGSTAHMACFGGDVEIIQALEQKGANFQTQRSVLVSHLPDLRESPSLSASLLYSRFEREQMMHCSPGVLAIQTRHIRAVTYCLELEGGLSVKETVKTWLTDTSVEGTPPTAPEKASTHGLVSLATSVLDNNILRLLLAKHADASDTDSFGGNAMFYVGHGLFRDETAAASDLLQVISTLKNAGVDINSVDQHGRTPLMKEAFQSIYSEGLILKALLDQGASANIVTRKGMTALMFAAISQRKSRSSCVRLLCERGAYANLKDVDGRTALDHALRNAGGPDQKEVVDLLWLHGAAQEIT